MPITVLVPPEAGSPHPLGPGMAAQWEFVGAIPAGWTWRYDITDEVDELTSVVGGSFPAQQNNPSVVIGEPYTPSTILSGSYKVPHNSQALFTVRLVDELQQVREIGNRAITYDALSGLPRVVVEPQAPIQGGFTQADRDVAQTTLNATVSRLELTTGLGELADVALSAQFGCPPGPLLVPALHGLLTGSGVIDRPAGGAGVYAYGFTFRFEVLPPGLSVIDGRALEFPERMAQFLVVKVDAAGNEYVSDRYEFHHDQERVCWGIPFPKRIEYSVLPGVSMRFFWLLFPVGQ